MILSDEVPVVSGARLLGPGTRLRGNNPAAPSFGRDGENRSGDGRANPQGIMSR